MSDYLEQKRTKNRGELDRVIVEGRHQSESGGTEITGAELLKLAWDKIKEIQYLGGGMVTFLEAENEEKLLSFYRDNRFSQFDTRQTITDTYESHELIQLLRLLRHNDGMLSKSAICRFVESQIGWGKRGKSFTPGVKSHQSLTAAQAAIANK